MTAYSIACLAGDGIGPEVMAQASRGLRAAARLHGLVLEEELVVAFARFKARADEGGALSIHELLQEVTLS